MQTILDVKLPHHFWGNLAEAKLAAQCEAANTGAAVICVDAVEISDRVVRFIGDMPAAAADESLDVRESTLRPGAFHTTWGAVLNPAGQIGFLVLPHPVPTAFCSMADSEDQVRVEVAFDRIFDSAPATVLGHFCCRSCKRPISPERLRALPGTQLCTDCKSRKEEELNGNQCACR